MKKIYKNLINVDLIKDFMRKNECDVKKLSQLSGVSVHIIEVILSGNSNVNIMKIIKIAKVMNVNFSKLINSDYEKIMLE